MYYINSGYKYVISDRNDHFFHKYPVIYKSYL